MSLIVVIHNDGTGSDDAANYDFQVYVNETKIAEGEIFRHDRKDGWIRLLERLFGAMKGVDGWSKEVEPPSLEALVSMYERKLRKDKLP